MSGRHLEEDKVLGKRGHFWPAFLQQNVLEDLLEAPSFQNRPESLGGQIKPDAIREALIGEFLSERAEEEKDLSQQEIKELRNKQKEILQSLLWDIEQVFNTESPSIYRRMKAVNIEEMFLKNFFSTNFFALYIKFASEAFEHKYQLSSTERRRLRKAFARLIRQAYEFSDFLSVVSTIKNRKRIRFYKYQSMEKLLAFFNYLYEVQKLLAEGDGDADKQALFETLNSADHRLQSLSLLKEKKTVLGIEKVASRIVPFVTPRPKCQSLVEKYQ